MFGSYLEVALPLLVQRITRSLSEWLQALNLSMSVTSVVIITIQKSFNYSNESAQFNSISPLTIFFAKLLLVRM